MNDSLANEASCDITRAPSGREDAEHHQDSLLVVDVSTTVAEKRLRRIPKPPEDEPYVIANTIDAKRVLASAHSTRLASPLKIVLRIAAE